MPQNHKLCPPLFACWKNKLEEGKGLLPLKSKKGYVEKETFGRILIKSSIDKNSRLINELKMHRVIFLAFHTTCL